MVPMLRRLPLSACSGSTHQFQFKNLSHTHSEQIISDQAEIALKGVNILTKFLLKAATLSSSATLNLLSGLDQWARQWSFGHLTRPWPWEAPFTLLLWISIRGRGELPTETVGQRQAILNGWLGLGNCLFRT